MTAHLTYLHRRNDTGAIFYVGKGDANRAKSHRGRSEHWHRVVRKHGMTVDIAASWPTEREALSHEVLLIACLRELGEPLVNQTDGGDGMSGHKHTPETKALMSAAAKGRPKSPAAREKMRAYRLGKPVSERARALIGAFHSARVRPKSEYDKQRLTNATPETKGRRSEAMKRALSDPEVKSKMLASRKASAAFASAMAKHRKPVECINTGIRYESVTAAAKDLNLEKSSISAVCRGRSKSSGGMIFRVFVIDR